MQSISEFVKEFAVYTDDTRYDPTPKEREMIEEAVGMYISDYHTYVVGPLRDFAKLNQKHYPRLVQVILRLSELHSPANVPGIGISE